MPNGIEPAPVVIAEAVDSFRRLLDRVAAALERIDVRLAELVSAADQIIDRLDSREGEPDSE